MANYNQSELERIEKFKRLVKLVFVGPKGLTFSNEDFIHDANYSDLKNDSDLPFLMKKMSVILNAINEKPELIDADIEETLWNLV